MWVKAGNESFEAGVHCTAYLDFISSQPDYRLAGPSTSLKSSKLHRSFSSVMIIDKVHLFAVTKPSNICQVCWLSQMF